MVQSIDNALITQFRDFVRLEAEQLTARTRPFVEMKMMDGDNLAYDGLGNVEAREITGRNQKVEFDDIEHTRRKLGRKRFAVTLPVDTSDLRGALSDPRGNYASKAVAALQRQFDRIVTDALFADVQTGREFDTTVTAAADGVVTVDATAGYTFEKLLEIKENFIKNEVGMDMNANLVIGISEKEHTALLGETELTSGDFSREFVLEKGQITRALGMQILMWGSSTPNPILKEIAGVRQGFAMSDTGICVGISKDIGVEVEKRPDLEETWQIKTIMEMGAVRTEGVHVQLVTTSV